MAVVAMVYPFLRSEEHYECSFMASQALPCSTVKFDDEEPICRSIYMLIKPQAKGLELQRIGRLETGLWMSICRVVSLTSEPIVEFSFAAEGLGICRLQHKIAYIILRIGQTCMISQSASSSGSTVRTASPTIDFESRHRLNFCKL